MYFGLGTCTRTVLTDRMVMVKSVGVAIGKNELRVLEGTASGAEQRFRGDAIGSYPGPGVSLICSSVEPVTVSSS